MSGIAFPGNSLTPIASNLSEATSTDRLSLSISHSSAVSRLNSGKSSGSNRNISDTSSNTSELTLIPFRTGFIASIYLGISLPCQVAAAVFQFFIPVW